MLCLLAVLMQAQAANEGQMKRCPTPSWMGLDIVLAAATQEASTPEERRGLIREGLMRAVLAKHKEKGKKARLG